MMYDCLKKKKNNGDVYIANYCECTEFSGTMRDFYCEIYIYRIDL